ncbi:MAG: DUF4926 domain-containing protein [Candidatus Sumerlaeaceae bacterium]|nr:DUF4926 domain-containing protein [Candidatus Sumerlaeaceae bacterium]
MIKEHDMVVLTEGLPEDRLTAGDVGTVVQVYQGGAGYEVEFMTLAGRTVAVATVTASQIRAVNPSDLVHVREMQTA